MSKLKCRLIIAALWLSAVATSTALVPFVIEWMWHGSLRWPF